jgi:F-type H+-transporting ATPase subunit epsilon
LKKLKMIKLRIVTPEGEVYNDDSVVGVTLPTEAGEIMVLEDHVPLTSVLQPGEIVIKKADHEVSLSVSQGAVQVGRDSVVNVLADTAERAEHIDIERAEEARQRAEEYMQQQENIEDVEFAQLQAKIQKEFARIQVGRKHRKLAPNQPV